MLSALIAVAFGIFEAFVLSKLLLAAISGNFKRLAIILLIKFITYAVAISFLIFLFPQYILNCVIGYSVGLPVTTVIWFIHKSLKEKNSRSGDGQNETNNNN